MIDGLRYPIRPSIRFRDRIWGRAVGRDHVRSGAAAHGLRRGKKCLTHLVFSECFLHKSRLYLWNCVKSLLLLRIFSMKVYGIHNYLRARARRTRVYCIQACSSSDDCKIVLIAKATLPYIHVEVCWRLRSHLEGQWYLQKQRNDREAKRKADKAK